MIGVADSGIGGLTLLRRLRSEYPKADFLYYADNGYAPYGSLDKCALQDRVLRVTEELFKVGAVHIVWACNTASTNCLSMLNGIYGYKITGVLPRVDFEPRGTLVMCTPLTAGSPRMVEYAKEGASVYADGRLAGLVESNRFSLFATRSYLEKVLSAYRPKRVVLGCTHYVYLKDVVQSIFGVPVYDSYDLATEAVKRSAPRKVDEGGSIEFTFSGRDESADYKALFESL